MSPGGSTIAVELTSPLEWGRRRARGGFGIRSRGPRIHNVSDCPVGNPYLCSLTDDLFDFGSMVDTVTSIVRVLAFTGATLLPWIVTGLFLGLIGALLCW